MSFRHGACKCCGGCELIATRTNCLSADEQTNCFEPGSPGCGPSTITFDPPESVSGRTTVSNTNAYPDGAPNFKWATGTSLTIEANEYDITCEGTTYKFRSLAITIDCPSNPGQSTQVVYPSRVITIDLPTDCAGCQISISANYRACLPSFNCTDCQIDLPPFPMVAQVTAPMLFRNLAPTGGGSGCNYIPYPTSGAGWVCPDGVDQSFCGFQQFYDDTLEEIAETCKEPAISQTKLVQPMVLICGGNVFILTTGFGQPLGIGDTVLFQKSVIAASDPNAQGNQVIRTVGTSATTLVSAAARMFLDDAQLLLGNLVGFIDVFARVTLDSGASSIQGVVTNSCQLAGGSEGSTTTVRVPATGTKLLGTFTPASGGTCFSPNLCDAVMAAFTTEGDYFIPNDDPNFDGVTLRIR